MIDLLALAADLEAIGAEPDIHDDTLTVSTGFLTILVYTRGVMCFATNDGGSVMTVPSIETDIFAVIARHAERMRPALAKAA